jgi:predicted RNA binding protein YcfA (HicA-like mRNA interferase family)
MPRDISGQGLIRGLERLGYCCTRQKGSHVRMSLDRNGVHHVTIPLHDPLKVGTLAAILGDVAQHLEMDRDELIQNWISEFR